MHGCFALLALRLARPIEVAASHLWWFAYLKDKEAKQTRKKQQSVSKTQKRQSVRRNATLSKNIDDRLKKKALNINIDKKKTQDTKISIEIWSYKF